MLFVSGHNNQYYSLCLLFCQYTYVYLVAFLDPNSYDGASMLHDIAQAVWFFLPAALANASPIGVAALPGLRRLNAPMDFGKQFRGKPILGHHKTWRGIVTGMVTATLVLWLQQSAVRHYGWAQQVSTGIPYDTLPTLLLGPAMGLGALLGDAVKSFFKRQHGTPSGDTWIPFDQLDYVLGGTLASLPFVRLSLVVYLWLFVVWFASHFLASWLGWKVGLKARPI